MSSITITTTTPAALNRRPISEIFRILNINSVHFLTISLLFIPFIFFTSVTAVNFPDSLTLKTLTELLAVAVTVIFSTVAGIALIIYSTHQALYRTPLTFISAFKSLSHSFIPLLSTITAGFIKLAFVFILITLSPLAVTELVNSLNLGFQFDISIISTIANIIGVITVLYFVVIWGSAAPISVLESKYGFTPLTESASQSTEFRFVSCLIVTITGCVIVVCLTFYPIMHNINPELKWRTIVQIGVSYMDFSLFVVGNIVANTVLYEHFKVASGEEEIGKTVVVEEEESLKGVFVGGFTYMIWFCIVLMWISNLIGVIG